MNRYGKLYALNELHRIQNPSGKNIAHKSETLIWQHLLRIVTKQLLQFICSLWAHADVNTACSIPMLDWGRSATVHMNPHYLPC